MSKARQEPLNEIQIAELREIFSLFDKNSDGYVNTNELAHVIRALGHNPTQAEIKEMEKDVDPNDTGSFDQINLIGLISRRPKQPDTLEEMIQAIKTIANKDGVEEGEVNKIDITGLKYFMCQSGELLQEYEFEEIMAECADLVHDSYIMIDAFAGYLMAR